MLLFLGSGMLDAAPALVPIPNVVGSFEEDAVLILDGSNFDAESTINTNNDYVLGVVYAQLPVAGTLAAPGTVVSLFVSGGPAPGTEEHDWATVRYYRERARRQQRLYTAARDMTASEAAQIRADVEAVMFEPETAPSVATPVAEPAAPAAAPMPPDPSLLAALMAMPPPVAPAPPTPQQQQLEAMLKLAEFSKGVGRG